MMMVLSCMGFGNLREHIVPGTQTGIPIMLELSMIPKKIMVAGSRTVFLKNCPLTRSPMPINGPWMMIIPRLSSALLEKPIQTIHQPG